jgi:hypothetical protein
VVTAGRTPLHIHACVQIFTEDILLEIDGRRVADLDFNDAKVRSSRLPPPPRLLPSPPLSFAHPASHSTSAIHSLALLCSNNEKLGVKLVSVWRSGSTVHLSQHSNRAENVVVYVSQTHPHTYTLLQGLCCGPEGSTARLVISRAGRIFNVDVTRISHEGLLRN